MQQGASVMWMANESKRSSNSKCTPFGTGETDSGPTPWLSSSRLERNAHMDGRSLNHTCTNGTWGSGPFFFLYHNDERRGANEEGHALVFSQLTWAIQSLHEPPSRQSPRPVPYHGHRRASPLPRHRFCHRH